jgi:C4-dicarboxylate-specific signal transduction histidine kinase
LRDVTLRKQLEAGLEASRTQLMASARLAALGTMAGGIAHEINTPLAVIHALASDLVEDVERHELTNESARDSAARIRDFAGRIARIIASMRQLAREGTTDPLEAARVADIVNDARDVCAERFRNSGVSLSVDPIDPRVTIRCRAGQISQVLVNLLQNAYDAVIEREGDRWVRLVMEVDVDAVSISVVDSGGGVPEDQKLRIMEPFFTTKPPGKGTGLGLSVSRQIILDHAGSFEVTERDGNTCFTLRLPRATDG